MGGYLAYTKYKDSGVEWLGNIPEHWTISKAKFVAQIFVPQRNKPELNTDEGLPWLTMDDMLGKKVFSTSWKVSAEDAIRAGSKSLEKGAVIATCVGNFGIAVINAIDVIINQQLQAFISRQVNPEYLRLVVTISSDYFQMVSTAATIEYVNRAGFANMPLPLPSSLEQQQIAAFLDYKTAQIDALIAKKEALLEKLAEKRTALISQAVTKGLDPTVPMKDSGIEWLGEIPERWRLLPLKYAVTFQRGHDLPADRRIEGQIPLVSSSGVSGCHNFAVAKGPGIITGRYGTIGQFTYVEEDYWPLNTTLYSIRTFGNNVQFLWYMMHNLSALFILNSQKSAVPGVDRNDLHPVLTALPPVEEQARIVDFLTRQITEVDKQTTKIRAAIEKLKEYRTALITNAVTGKIDVRDIKLPQSTSAEAA